MRRAREGAAEQQSIASPHWWLKLWLGDTRNSANSVGVVVPPHDLDFRIVRGRDSSPPSDSTNQSITSSSPAMLAADARV